MIVGPKKTLFMDEISTGLDSSTTFQIVKCLRDFAHVRQATMLISLLQPPPETHNLFDDVLLLSQGDRPCCHVLELLKSVMSCQLQALKKVFRNAVARIFWNIMAAGHASESWFIQQCWQEHMLLEHPTRQMWNPAYHGRHTTHIYCCVGAPGHYRAVEHTVLFLISVLWWFRAGDVPWSCRWGGPLLWVMWLQVSCSQEYARLAARAHLSERATGEWMHTSSRSSYWVRQVGELIGLCASKVLLMTFHSLCFSCHTLTQEKHTFVNLLWYITVCVSPSRQALLNLLSLVLLCYRLLMYSRVAMWLCLHLDLRS